MASDGMFDNLEFPDMHKILKKVPLACPVHHSYPSVSLKRLYFLQTTAENAAKDLAEKVAKCFYFIFFLFPFSFF